MYGAPTRRYRTGRFMEAFFAVQVCTTYQASVYGSFLCLLSFSKESRLWRGRLYATMLYAAAVLRPQKGARTMIYSVYELVWFFFLYSFLAWVAVEVVTAIRRRTVPNMGFLNL